MNEYSICEIKGHDYNIPTHCKRCGAYFHQILLDFKIDTNSGTLTIPFKEMVKTPKNEKSLIHLFDNLSLSK